MKRKITYLFKFKKNSVQFNGKRNAFERELVRDNQFVVVLHKEDRREVHLFNQSFCKKNKLLERRFLIDPDGETLRDYSVDGNYLWLSVNSSDLNLSEEEREDEPEEQVFEDCKIQDQEDSDSGLELFVTKSVGLLPLSLEPEVEDSDSDVSNTESERDEDYIWGFMGKNGKDDQWTVAEFHQMTSSDSSTHFS